MHAQYNCDKTHTRCCRELPFQGWSCEYGPCNSSMSCSSRLELYSSLTEFLFLSSFPRQVTAGFKEEGRQDLDPASASGESQPKRLSWPWTGEHGSQRRSGRASPSLTDEGLTSICWVAAVTEVVEAAPSCRECRKARRTVGMRPCMTRWRRPSVRLFVSTLHVRFAPGPPVRCIFLAFSGRR